MASDASAPEAEWDLVLQHTVHAGGVHGGRGGAGRRGEGPRWAIPHVDDSRVYRLRDGQLEQLSTHHSVAQQLIGARQLTDAGAAHHLQWHIITRALDAGRGPSDQPDVVVLPVVPGDRFLACSTG